MKAFGVQAIALSAASLGLFAATAVGSVNWSNTTSGSGPFAFETASNWTATTYTTPPFYGPELTPPGFDSSMFIEGFNGTVVLTDKRSGDGDANPADDAIPALGALAIGGGNSSQISTLVLRNDVSFTGLERIADGNYNATLRHIRVGRDDNTPADSLYPWGVVRQEAGAVRLMQNVTTVTTGPTPVSPSLTRAEILLSSDKDASAGSIWEVGGTGSLYVPDQLRVGDRPTATSMPGAIFRVRGSNAGPIEIDEFDIASDAGLWDAHRDGSNRLQFNRGKSVAEFVLDAGGVAPVTVLDNLDIGDVNSYPASHTPETGLEYSYGFLRIKLSEPTTAGSGAVGSGQELVLFKADRISTDTQLPTGTDYDEGRFFDPDHMSAGGGPHRPLFDSENPVDATPTVYRVLADYAGAQYSWRIDYFDSLDDGTVVDAVVLSELQKTGVEGDLNGDLTVTEADRSDLLAAISSFAADPLGYHNLIGGAQNLYDLNADDHIDNLDRQVFAEHFLPEAGLAGDFNGDMKVDAADYTVWRNNLGAADESSLNGNGNGMNGVDAGDYNLWKANFGDTLGAAALGAGAVPEPGTVILSLAGALGMLGLRRRMD